MTAIRGSLRGIRLEIGYIDHLEAHMFTAIKAVVGPHIKTFGGAIIAGAGFTVGAAVAGGALEAVSKTTHKMAQYIDNKTKERKLRNPPPYAQPVA